MTMARRNTPHLRRPCDNAADRGDGGGGDGGAGAGTRWRDEVAVALRTLVVCTFKMTTLRQLLRQNNPTLTLLAGQRADRKGEGRMPQEGCQGRHEGKEAKRHGARGRETKVGRQGREAKQPPEGKQAAEGKQVAEGKRSVEHQPGAGSCGACGALVRSPIGAHLVLSPTVRSLRSTRPRAHQRTTPLAPQPMRHDGELLALLVKLNVNIDSAKAWEYTTDLAVGAAGDGASGRRHGDKGPHRKRGAKRGVYTQREDAVGALVEACMHSACALRRLPLGLDLGPGLGHLTPLGRIMLPASRDLREIDAHAVGGRVCMYASNPSTRAAGLLTARFVANPIGCESAATVGGTATAAPFVRTGPGRQGL